ncbi:MAG: hypothetical protein ACM3ZE_11680 [Myxococcales bacterium]
MHPAANVEGNPKRAEVSALMHPLIWIAQKFGRAKGLVKTGLDCATVWAESENCTAYDNVEYGIRLPHQWPEYSPLHIVQNCLDYANGSEAVVNAGSTDDHNSWNTDVIVSAADSLSVDSKGVDGPRGHDGSPPNLDFLKLAPGSDLIDRGLDLGLRYSGSAPDLGAFERQ